MDRSDHVWIGFFSELEKYAYATDMKEMNERLRLGSAPAWPLAGALTGFLVGRNLLKKMGPKAHWPIAILGALAGGTMAYAGKRLSESGGSEEALARSLLPKRVR